MPKRKRSDPQHLSFGAPPLRGFLIHLIVFIIVIGVLGTINMLRNPTHPWFLWVLIAWGIALAGHDILLLVKSRPKSAPSKRAAAA